MKLLVIFIMLCFGCSMNGRDKKTAALLPQHKFDTLFVVSKTDSTKRVAILSGDLENTLKMYAGKDSLELFVGEHYLKIFSANHIKFGIIGDSLFRVYKIDGAQVTKLSTEKKEMRLQQFVIIDVNGDGYNDAVIYDNMGSPNDFAKVLVYQPKSGGLKHCAAFGLENLTIDTKHKLLRSWHIPHSVFGGYTKAVYHYEDGTVKLVKSVLYYQGQAAGNSNKAFVVTHNLSDTKVVIDSLKTTVAKGFCIFNNAIWDSRDVWIAHP